MPLNLLYENILFVVTATLFLVVVGWTWRNAKPYDLPQPLPDWFKVWFLTMQIGGIGLPLVGLVWSIWQGYSSVALVLVSYFVLLVLQILCESLSLRQFRSVVFVMVPYIYLPYRVWQLYEGLTWLNLGDELPWIQNLLLLEIVLWTGNYALDVTQLPRLLHWEVKDDGSY
ncbi:hypothetical protein [Leptolyngbya sp. FACHB-261]|uniref:hypothetical protein n=1 Tax=Leptolyngbya sp. FACHB-261 TaxID=2692806 RepID=UPI0016889D47|nr:hypothetical protein [Leptolyngbya sp. FACHB-261]MBD2099430.1 hypothetical protein [Leptolyngbya sp. FACHB-261]